MDRLALTPCIRRSPVTAPHTTPCKVLFFPHSGGSAGSYQHLASHLAGIAQTACVQYPGRAERRRDPLFTDVHALADDVAEESASWREGSPVIFFGHSLGAAVAYEVIRRTANQQQMVLVASGHPAPSRLKLPPMSMPSGSSKDPDEPLIELIKSLGGDDPDLLDHPVLRQLFLPVIRSDLAAHSRYRPGDGSTISCPIIALRGESDPLTNVPDVQAWEQHTSSTLRVHTLPGGHFFTNQHTGDVADILRFAMSTSCQSVAPTGAGLLGRQ